MCVCVWALYGLLDCGIIEALQVISYCPQIGGGRAGWAFEWACAARAMLRMFGMRPGMK